MQSRDKGNNISRRDAQFTGTDLIGQKAAGCGCVRLLCKQGKEKKKEEEEMCTHMHNLRHSDRIERPCESSLAEVEGKADAKRSLFIRPERGL